MSALPKTRHARRRLERRVRRASRPEGALAQVPSLEVADPLTEKPKRLSVLRLAVVAGAAVVAHAFVLTVFSAAGTLAARFHVEKDDPEKIEVAIVDPPPPPPPPAVPEPPAPPEPEPPPPPKPKKAPVVKEVVPSKDPINTPPEPPKEPPKEEPKRVVGLDVESTVEGGEGPAFAAGNTRMGETDTKAVDPNAVTKLTGPAEPPRAGKRADKPTVLPKRKKNIAPTYPERYREQGIEGDVVVRVTVDPAGKPKEVVVVKPSDYEFFNAEAKKAALREEYSPAMRDGVAVEYSVSFKYLFRLDT